MVRVVVAILCLFAVESQAARIQKLSPKRTLALIIDADTVALKVNDGICLDRAMKARICGLVIQIKERTLVFSQADKKHNLEPGDDVSITPTPRKFASKENDPSGVTMDIMGGRARNLRESHLIVIGSNLVQPMIRFEQAFARHWSVGIMPSFLYFPVSDGSGNSGAVSGWGAYGTVSYYFGRPYRGLYLMGAGGFSFITASLGTDTGNTATMSAIGTIGYRWMLGTAFNFGLSAGGQYFTNQNTTVNNLSIAIPAFFPAAFAEVGVAF